MCGIFHRPLFFGICFATLLILQVSVGIYIGGVLTTLETQYRITTTLAGLAVATSDIASLISILGVTYVGKSWHRPRIIGVLTIMTGVGGILSGLPHFLYPAYRDTGPPASNETYTSSITHCDAGRADAPECDVGGSRVGEMWLLFIGQALMGLAYGPLFPIGLTYLDDQVKGTTTPYYVSAFFTAGSAATLLGFGQAFLFLTRWVNWPAQFVDFSLEWIGGWWMGFILDGIIIMFVAIPFFFFPKEMDNDVKVEDIPPERLAKEGTHGQTVSELGLKDLMSTAKRIIRNPVFMFLMVSTIFELAVSASFGFFMPKFFEIRYNVVPSFAALLVGILVTPGALLGNLVSGLFVKKLKLSSVGCGAMAIGLSAVITFVIPIIYFLGCPEANYVGYNDGVLSTDLECSMDCGCTLEQFNPVCIGQEHVFVTPCYAGCNGTTREEPTDDPAVFNKIYTNCSCAAGLEIAQGPTTEATEGKCEGTCDKIYYVSVLVFVIALFGSMAQNPLLIMQVRAVGQDKTFGLGITAFFSRALGFLPAPLYFGAAIDGACVLDRIECGKEGDCLVYNSQLFSVTFLGIFYGLKLFVLFFYTLGTLSAVHLNRNTNETDEKKGEIPDLEMDGVDNKGFQNSAM